MNDRDVWLELVAASAGRGALRTFQSAVEEMRPAGGFNFENYSVTLHISDALAEFMFG